MKPTRLLALLALAAASLTATATAAASHTPYSISIEDAEGRTLPSYPHRGQVFVLGQDGQRYVIRVTNHTSRRVEAVVSVDGRDVLSGQPGDFENQRGYVVDPHASVVIEGFRKSLHGVAAFRFTRPGNSYSARMGTPENVGIIGAAFFEERRTHRMRSGHLRAQKKAEHSPRHDAFDEREARPAPTAPSPSRSGAGRADASSSAPRSEASRRGRASAEPGYDDHSHIGTEYGEHRHSQVREVAFVRHSARTPQRVVTLRYDDARGLEERGIALYPPTPRGPRAFPISRFAPPPPPRW